MPRPSRALSRAVSGIRNPRLSLEALEDRSVPATLTLTIPATSMSEGAGANAVGALLNRTGDLSQSLTVNLSSSDTTEATVPATVTFAAGQQEVGFSISAVDDAVVDGTQTVTITATADIVQGQPFGLDLSYGSGGLAPTSLEMAIQPPVQVIALQPDGKAVVASENTTDNGWHVQRFNANGTLDSSFGSGLVNTTGLGSFAVPHAAIVQADGKILIGGKVSGGTAAPILVRYNANGTLDTTFGVGGIANLSSLTNFWVTDIALRPDGRILLGLGQNGSIQSRVAQLNPNGSFDSTFGSGGTSALNLGYTAEYVEVLADGTFLVGGSFRMPVFVAKVQPNGVGLVSSFGTNGVGALDFGTDGSGVVEMAVDAQGRIVVGAYVFDFVSGNSTPGDFAAGRLNANGTPDTSFAGDGTAVLDAGGSDFATALVVQQDGKVLLGGRVGTNTVPSVIDTAMVRFNANGTPDTTFDGDGIYRQSLGDHVRPRSNHRHGPPGGRQAAGDHRSGQRLAHRPLPPGASGIHPDRLGQHRCPRQRHPEPRAGGGGLAVRDARGHSAQRDAAGVGPGRRPPDLQHRRPAGARDGPDHQHLHRRVHLHPARELRGDHQFHLQGE